MFEKKEENLCELCKESATNICFDCQFYLCETCFEFLHSKKANTLHKKEDINPIIPLYTKCKEHPKVPISHFSPNKKGKLFYLIFNFIEIYCQICSGHSRFGLFGPSKNEMIDINDNDALNISLTSYDESVSQYYTLYKEVKNLKTAIEDEIQDINKSSIQLFTQMNKFFNYKRYCINKTQKELKSDFHRRINEIKEELQHFLSQSNEIISSLDKIRSEIVDFDSKKKESHLIKIWCYVSEINKYNEKANVFINEPKRTLLFSFDESKISINYSNYYFSGLPVPEDICVEKIEENKIEISWQNDEYKIKDKNNRNKIK